MKVQITKCYLVQVVDTDGYEITSEYVFADLPEAKERGKQLKREVLESGAYYE